MVLLKSPAEVGLFLFIYIMKITREQLNGMEVPAPHVLVKIPSTDNNFILSGKDNDLKLTFDPSYEKERHTTVVGEVVKVGTGDMELGGMLSPEWICDMEIEVGDEVIMEYLAVRIACGDYGGMESKMFVLDGEVYIWVMYQFIICKIDWEEVALYPLNGYVICKTLQQLAETGGVNLETIIYESDIYAEVMFTGGLIKEYSKHLKAGPDKDNIHPGDLIVISPHTNLPLQYSMHRSILGEFKLVYLQRREIVAKVPNQLPEISLAL